MTQAIEFFDSTSINPGSKGFSGAVYDGRYLYFVPMANGPGRFFGQVTRYDTHSDFHDSASWTVFDTALVNAASRGFADGLFDGRYLYLIPYHHDRHHGQVTRYDTQCDFHNPDSWNFFDIQKIVDNGRGFVSGCYDGQYLYLAPYQLKWNAYHGTMVRYDTTRAFSAIDSWEVFDSNLLATLSRGFHSAVNGGEFIYFVPFVREQRDYHGLLVCYRRGGTFIDPASWQIVDLKKFNPRGCGYIGGCYDGQYLYLAPYFDGNNRFGQVACHDSRQSLDDGGSWQFFDTELVYPESRGFFGSFIHNEFVYFIPHCKAEGIYNGQITRYDRRLPFINSDAWSVFDTTTYHAMSKGYIGGAVIGNYLYMAPYETSPANHSGLITRIDLNIRSVWQ
ncbi:conserved hypothetical protein [Gammaproteobacteria bacterium]